MKNDILVGFALALLTHLNAYGIITKGKRMLYDFRKKKKKKKTHNPNTKILRRTQTRYTHCCKFFMVGLAALLEQVTGIRLSVPSQARPYSEA